MRSLARRAFRAWLGLDFARRCRDSDACRRIVCAEVVFDLTVACLWVAGGVVGVVAFWAIVTAGAINQIVCARILRREAREGRA